MKTGKQFVTLWNLFWATFKQCFETWQRMLRWWMGAWKLCRGLIYNFLFLLFPSLYFSILPLCVSHFIVNGRDSHWRSLNCIMHLSQRKSAGNAGNWDVKSPVSRCTLLARLELHNNKRRSGYKAKFTFCPVRFEFPQPPISMLSRDWWKHN